MYLVGKCKLSYTGCISVLHYYCCGIASNCKWQKYMVEGTGVPGENHRLNPSNWQLSYTRRDLNASSKSSQIAVSCNTLDHSAIRAGPDIDVVTLYSYENQAICFTIPGENSSVVVSADYIHVRTIIEGSMQRKKTQQTSHIYILYLPHRVTVYLKKPTRIMKCLLLFRLLSRIPRIEELQEEVTYT